MSINRLENNEDLNSNDIRTILDREAADWLEFSQSAELVKREFGQDEYGVILENRLQTILEAILKAKETGIEWVDIAAYDFPADKVLEYVKKSKITLSEEIEKGIKSLIRQ